MTYRLFIRLAICVSSLHAVVLPAGADNLLTFSNSSAISEVIGLNDQGAILGRHERSAAGILSMDTYLRIEGQERAPSIPDQNTHIELLALSNRGHAVGYTSRPPGHPNGSQRAMVWTIDTDVTELLPLPKGLQGSYAFDISKDGRRVCGFVLGGNPPRLQPCIWENGPTGWHATLLQVKRRFNPLLTSAHVKLSDNGRVVAGSLVINISPEGIRTYGLFVWKQDESGTWQRQELIDRAVRLGDVNDAGFVAGRVLEKGKHRAFIYDPDVGPQILDLPPGRSSAYATGVNRHGQVVGVAEDPPGPDSTMSAFLWHDGKLTPLPFGVEVVASTANAITDEGRVGGLLVRAEPPNDRALIDRALIDRALIESYVLRIPVPSDP